MALKYTIEYNDVSDETHKLEIYDDDFVGSNTDINGTVFYDFSETDDVLNPIKGSGLRVELDADTTLDFSDLYSEYEKDFKVKYYRDSVMKFQGWINPEGWYEDFVNDKWQVTFDCIDGLSFLENLGYVDSNGNNFTVQQTALEVISACLLRTGLEQDIKADVGLVYTGLTETLDILENLKVDPIRYIKDDNENTVMSCKEVLSSILDTLTACVASVDGEWIIYRPNQLANSSTFSYYHYDFEGARDSTYKGTKSLTLFLGSEVDSFFPHHCSANQSIRNQKSVGAYRINYKYGVRVALLDNIYLESDGTTIDDWTRDVTIFTAIPPSKLGIILYAIPTEPTTSQRNLYSDGLTLATDDLVDVSIKFDSDLPTGGDKEYFQYKIIVDAATDRYYNGSTWSTTDTMIKKELNNGQETVNILQELTIPTPGDLRVELWRPEFDAGTPIEFNVYIHEVKFTVKDEQEDIDEGENHNFERITAPNSKVADTKEVFNGDNISSIRRGVLFKADGTSLTSTWNRKGETETYSILRLMGNETMRLKQNTSRVFSGSVFGYFDFLSVVSINGFGIETNFDRVWLVTKWSYDTRSNIVDAEFTEVFADEVDTDISYNKEIDYGNVVTPTIRG